jgi:hypothetical protein
MNSRKHPFWKWGERAELARLARIRPHHLAEILHFECKRTVSYNMARRLSEASGIVLGAARRIEPITWLECKTTKHPAFRQPE